MNTGVSANRGAQESRRARGPGVMLVRVTLLAILVAIGGCASFSTDGGFAPVESAARDRLGATLTWPRSDAQRSTVDQRVAELLAQQPLSADDAVQVALLNNRGLRAAYAELGIAEAELVQAGRLPNPGFVFARKTQAGEVEIERLFTLNLAHLIAMPLVDRGRDAAPAKPRNGW